MKIKTKAKIGREYRVLAIAVVFFAVGLFFFIKDQTIPAPQTKPTAAPTLSVASPQGASFPDPTFAKYPAPSNFEKFTYENGEIDGASSLSVSATCNGQYVAILIYPGNFDYRLDVSRSVYNKSFPCDTGKTFNHIIEAADLSTLQPGSYYLMTADQGASGPWYNPK